MIGDFISTHSTKRRASGFTLIELLVVMAIVAVLLGIVAPRYVKQTDRAREAALKSNLDGIRTALDHFYADNGAYPERLTELVEKQYLRVMPVDPVTERSDTWIASVRETHAEEEGGKTTIDEVHSGAAGNASDGTAFRSW